MGLARLGRCPSQCELGLGDLSKPTAPAYFGGVKLMFDGVMNFGQVLTLRFVGVKIFWSKSNLNSVILIPSNELASICRYWTKHKFNLNCCEIRKIK